MGAGGRGHAVDLDIERGETFALLGPNGAGTFTTVEILEGYRTRTSGEVTVLGVDPDRGGAAWKARPGIVLQTSAEAINLNNLPEWLQKAASVFPLKWMAQGMRSIFLPDTYAAAEQGGVWNLPGVALVLALWLVGGLVASVLTFRWIRRS